MNPIRAHFLVTMLAAGLIAFAGHAIAALEPAPDSDRPFTQDRVIAHLNQTLAWYRHARVAIRALGAVFAREDEQTALAVVRRAFETAKLEAAALKVAAPPTQGQPAQTGPLVGKRAEVNTAIQTDLQQIEQLRQRLRTSPASRRAALNDELAAARNRLELDRIRFEFLTKLEESKVASSAGTESDLVHQIQALQESVPELGSANAPATAATPSAPAGSTWGLVRRLIEIQH